MKCFAAVLTALACPLTMAVPLVSSGLWDYPVFLINNKVGNQFAIDFNEKRLIQTANDKAPIWVDETEKLRLKRQGINFFDITELYNNQGSTLDLSVDATGGKQKGIYTFPTNVTHSKEIKQLNKLVSKDILYNNLANFSSFHTRYYKSSYGVESAEWLFTKIKETTNYSEDIIISKFGHASFPQFSIIVTIPGEDFKSLEDKGKVVIVGSHQDSTNLLFPNLLAAPGADDNGSGTVTALETLRVIVASGLKPKNTLEFHFYAAEEGGLLGSQDVYAAYGKKDVDVVAHLQNDMTGYIQNCLDKGLPPTVGIINDETDAGLNQFIKVLIDQFCTFSYAESKCGYACSDHASATKFGYQSAFVFESPFELHNNYIHSTKDTIDRLDFDHIAEFVKMTVGFAYELSLTEF